MNTLLKEKSFWREEKAQVAFEYLLTAVFAIMLAIAAALIVQTFQEIAAQAQSEILDTREQTINQILK